MKANTHPTWYDDAKVTCACGNSYTIGSTLPAIKLEICSKCHPFYTGQQKFVDTLGQVERFQKKQQVQAVKQEEKQQILQARAERAQSQKGDKPSLKDLLMQARKNINS